MTRTALFPGLRKTLLLTLLLLLTGTAALSAQTAYPPRGWITDLRQAQEIARTENKKILLNFTGSDWCSWCAKLRTEVFNTPSFEKFAGDNLVLVFLDFPARIKLSQAQQTHNQLIAQTLGVQGYPTIFVLDADLTPRLKTGYTGASPAIYNLHLAGERNITAAQAAVLKGSLERLLPSLPAL